MEICQWGREDHEVYVTTIGWIVTCAKESVELYIEKSGFHLF